MRFVVVGDGPQAYRQRLVEQAHSLGLDKRLVWAASRRDVTQVYNALDICCSASLFGEGFPNVVGEAMACDVPCVVTEVGDSAWVAGDTGIAVAPNDCQALSEAIARLSGLSRQARASLGRQARQRVVENFSSRVMVGHTEDALETLVGDRRR